MTDSATTSGWTASDSSLISEGVAQFPHGTEQMPLHAALVEAEGLRHLRGRAVFDMPEDEHLPLTLGKLSESSPDPPSHLGAACHLDGAQTNGGQLNILDGVAPAPKSYPPAGASSVATGVDGHLREPRRPVTRRSRPESCLVSLHKGVLNDLFGFLLVPQEKLAEPTQPPVVRPHQVFMSRPAIRVAGSDVALSSIDEQDDAPVDPIRRSPASSNQSVHEPDTPRSARSLLAPRSTAAYSSTRPAGPRTPSAPKGDLPGEARGQDRIDHRRQPQYRTCHRAGVRRRRRG